MRAVLALVLIGCGSPAVAPVKHVAEPVKRETPAPTIRWDEERFQWQGLPAVARDRSQFVLPLVDNDGGRGYPNLTIEVRDASDRVVQTLDVMIANDYERLVVDGHPTPELSRRIEQTNRELASLHDTHDLVPMLPVEGKPPITVDAHRWPAPQGARVPGAPPCENTASLKAIYWAHDIHAIVAQITYRGTDTCWEPGDQLHVVTW